MYYSYIENEYIATSFSPAGTDLAVKLLVIVDNARLLISEHSKAKYIGNGLISVVPHKGWARDIRVQFGRKSSVNNMKRQRRQNWDGGY